jgi:hypothetical protein
MTSPEDNNEQPSLGIDFTLTEAGEVEISAVSRPDEDVRGGDVVELVDDGLPAERPEQVLSGWCDGSRPRRPDVPITMRLRRNGESLTVKLFWLPRISDEAAIVAPVDSDTTADNPTLEELVSASALETHNEGATVDSEMAPEPLPSAATSTLLPNDIEPTFADLAEMSRISRCAPPRSPFLDEFLRWSRRPEVSYSAIDVNYDPFK